MEQHLHVLLIETLKPNKQFFSLGVKSGQKQASLVKNGGDSLNL
jgi:hypothetical protein